MERAVFGIGLKQPVEAEQRGEQRGDPEIRRTDARQQRLIRPQREGGDRDEAQEEHRRPC